MKRVYAFENRCLGCGLCEVYCKTAHSKSKDIIKANRNENITSAIVIEEILQPKAVAYFALQCRHCDDAKCVKACIAGAMYKDENGVVRNDKDKCVACLSCLLVCPFGAVKKTEEGKTVSKCDLCIDFGAPACVENCPNGALKLLDDKEAEALK
ncbi:4Fe-4S dicluster domain-containing protein [Endomicrobium proavitum]|uniref:4Fe-4S ferredoxin iron-sulfur binding domain protein n=1 Tax=Endomicrobium proavitum TaxID=1408281 RepID=A0A0G3WIN6_9BACT|nr:4Fe-4S dicluster domain-containing protein [Endomicrobium proavitum]AKL97742.1 4Fe-4S ferredoxin iron-sulfur binding domain protein [Endomicrobium proavitum]